MSDRWDTPQQVDGIQWDIQVSHFFASYCKCLLMLARPRAPFIGHDLFLRTCFGIKISNLPCSRVKAATVFATLFATVFAATVRKNDPYVGGTAESLACGDQPLSQ